MPTSRLIAGSIKLFAGRFGVSLVSLAFYGIAAHVVPKAKLAPLAAMAIIAELLRMGHSLGITTTMLRQVPESAARSRPDEAAAMVRSAFLYTGLMALLLAAAGWLWRGRLYGLILKQPADAPVLGLILAFAFLMAIYDSLQLAMLSLQWFGRHSLAHVVTLGGQRMLALALLFPFGVRGCLAGFVVGAAIGVALAGYWLRGLLLRPVKPLGFARLMTQSLPYYLEELPRYVLHEGDQLVVGVLLDPEALVSFFIAKRLIHGVRMAIDAATDALRPGMGQLRALGPEASRQGFRRASRFLAYGVLPLTLSVAAVSRPLMLFFAGPDYADAGPILLVLALAMAFYGIFSLFEVSIHMLGRPWQRLGADAVAAGAMVAGFVLLCPRLAGMGVALGELAGFAAALLFAAWLWRRISEARADWVALRRTLVAAGVAFVVVGALSLWLDAAWSLPVMLALGAGLFAWLFRAATRGEDADEICSALPAPLGRMAARLLRPVPGRSAPANSGLAPAETSVQPLAVNPRGQPRVLMVIAFLDHLGGAQRQAWLLAGELRRRGVQVSFLTARLRGLPAEEEVEGITVRRVPFLDGIRLGPMKFHLLIRALEREMLARADEFDLLHAHQALWPAYAAARAADKLGKPCIIKVGNTGPRGDFEVLSRSPIFGRRMARYLLRQTSCVVPTSAAAERELRQLGFEAERVALIPNGVRLPERFERPDGAARSALGLREDERLILFVGALSPHKRPLLALESFRRVAAETPSAQLWFLGDGPLRRRLERRRRELGLADRVRLLGEERQVERYLRAADVFMLPSAVEGMSNALLEAMAHELACVATRISGSEDLIRDGENGLLVAPDDGEALASALRRALADDGLRRWLGAEARRTIEQGYDIRAVAERYLDLYRRTLAEPHLGSGRKIPISGPPSL